MSQKISERELILLGNITGTEKMPLGVDGDLAINPNLLGSFLSVVFDASYWPLGGAAELTGPVTIDGNNFDLIFGSPDVLNGFEVYVDNTVHIESDDGADQSYFEVVPNQVSIFGKDIIRLDVDDGIGGTGVFQIHSGTGFLFESSVQLVFGANDGVNSSAFTLTPDHYHIALNDVHIHSDGTSIDLEVDDGVDSSSLSLTPTGLAFTLQTYTVAGVPSASPAGRLIYVSNESGGPQPAFSDGTDWRRITDGNIIAA